MLFLRGYHSQLDPPDTVRRRLTSRSILTRWRGLKRFLRRTVAQVGAASWRSRERPAAATQEQKSGDRRCPAKAAGRQRTTGVKLLQQRGTKEWTSGPAHRLGGDYAPNNVSARFSNDSHSSRSSFAFDLSRASVAIATRIKRHHLCLQFDASVGSRRRDRHSGGDRRTCQLAHRPPCVPLPTARPVRL